jgi:sugar phosphate isomerase/epimerase
MALWFSSGAFQARDIDGILIEAAEIGIHGIELSSGMAYTDNLLDSVRIAHMAGKQRFLVHNYFPPPKQPFVLNVAAMDEDSLTKSKAMGRAALELARELGAPFYSLHAGFAAKLKPELLGKPESQANTLTAKDINRELAYEIMVQTVRELADFAALMGLELLIENNVISPLYLEKMPINPLLLTEGAEIVRFFGDVKRPNVGLLLDVAHAKVSATALGFSPEAFVEQVGSHVRCLHLSDNDGREDSNQPFAASAWFMSRLKDFAHCEIVVEAYRLPAQTMLSQRELLERILS